MLKFLVLVIITSIQKAKWKPLVSVQYLHYRGNIYDIIEIHNMLIGNKDR